MIEQLIEGARLRAEERERTNAERRRAEEQRQADEVRFRLLGVLAYWFGEDFCVACEMVPGRNIAKIVVNGTEVQMYHSYSHKNGEHMCMNTSQGGVQVYLDLYHPDETKDKLLLTLGQLVGLV